MSVYYFAFGSNMNKERMIVRNAEFTEMLKGILKEWKLVFNKINSKKNGIVWHSLILNSYSSL